MYFEVTKKIGFVSEKRTQFGAFFSGFSSRLGSFWVENRFVSYYSCPFAVLCGPRNNARRSRSFPRSLASGELARFRAGWMVLRRFAWVGCAPLPIANFGQVLAELFDVLLVLDELVLKLLLEIDAPVARLWQAINGGHDEVEAIQIIQHRHVEGRGDGPFFLVTADVQVLVVGAAVGQSVDQPRVGMERKDDRLVFGEKLVEIRVAQPVRVLGLRLQFHEVDDVDHANFQVGQMFAHNGNGGERLQRGPVAP